MKIFLKLSLIFTLLACPYYVSCQNLKSTNYYNSIKKHDLSKLWRSDSIKIEGNGDKIPFPEPLGYIGNNYQRFYIHYVTVLKNKENPYQYDVYGKTKVKDNICEFKGTITIKKAVLYDESDDSNYKQGTLICDIKFYEDSTQKSTGKIIGTLKSEFHIDKKGKLNYDAIMFVADGYKNNQCKAMWTSYTTNVSKKCNWGDFRMPDSRELDGGAGDVVISEKFKNNGWTTFVDAYSVDQKKAEKAYKIEKSKWWK